MECPKCHSVNVTSCGVYTGKWQCMNGRCGVVFDREVAYRRMQASRTAVRGFIVPGA